MSWKSNPKRMFDEADKARSLDFQRRRDKLLHHPSFLNCLKEEATYGDWVDHEHLWYCIQIIFKSQFTEKYAIDLLLKIEDKITKKNLEWKERYQSL